jgi:hypothetical protein
MLLEQQAAVLPGKPGLPMLENLEPPAIRWWPNIGLPFGAATKREPI